MNNTKVNEALKEGCVEAQAAFEKIGLDDYATITSKLEFVIGSYENDMNPVGLHEIGSIALSDLKAYKEVKPRGVTKKVLDKLEKTIKKYEETYK